MHDQPPIWLFALFLLLFAGMWLLVTTILSYMSGWIELQARYPAAPEHALLRLRGLSGTLGTSGMFPKVNFNRVLTLSACPSGLRVSQWRIFGPFTRPFLVPWDEIGIEPKTGMLGSRARLRFGDPEVATLTVETYAWQRLAESAGRSSEIPMSERVERGDFARTLLLQWLVVAGIMAGFLVLVSQMSDQPGFPLAICIGFPALAVGVPMLIRYLRLR